MARTCYLFPKYNTGNVVVPGRTYAMGPELKNAAIEFMGLTEDLYDEGEHGLYDV